MLRAILFDLDDTLYEYAPCNALGLEAVYERLRRETEVSVAGFRQLHDEVRLEWASELRGMAASHDRLLFFKRMTERLFHRPRPNLALELVEAYWESFLLHMELTPEKPPLLKQLSQSYALGLVTNNTTRVQLLKLRRLGLGELFSAVVTSEEVGVEKPDRRIFERALEQLQVPPEEAVMVGDDPERDLIGAVRAGLPAILTTEFVAATEESELATAVISRLDELPKALDGVLTGR